MFDPTSRYFRVENAVFTDANGRNIIYKRRRTLAPVDESARPVLAEVRAGDRLDSIAARTLGDPLQFWRIADANRAMNPITLMERRTLVVPSVVPDRS